MSTFVIMAAAVVLAALLLISMFVALFMRRVVPTNEVHIVQTGKSTTSYGKDFKSNSYYSWPSWMPLLGLRVSVLPVSVFAVRLDEYEAYDKDRVPFLVDVVSFFRIIDSNTAAQRVATFEELQSQLEVIVQGAVRTVLAKDDIDQIMLERSKFGQMFTAEVREQLTNWGVEPVKSIELMDIRDTRGSTVIHNIMAKRTSEIEKDSRVEVAKNKRLGEIAEIEAQREIELQRQQAEENVGQRTAEKEQNVGIANERAQQQIKQEKRSTAEREQEVRRVTEVKTAEITRDVQIVKAEQDKRTSVINAEASRETVLIQAEAKKTQTVLNAEGDLEAKKRGAEGILAEGNAKGEAEKAILMAPVHAQIALAEKIGSDQGYQHYLLSVRQIEASEAIGKANAASLEKAGIKVIANAGTVGEGINSLGQLFSPQGGQSIGTLLEGFAQTPAGRAVLDKVLGKPMDEKGN